MHDDSTGNDIDIAALHLQFEGANGTTFLFYAEDADLVGTVRDHLESMTPIERAVLVAYAQTIIDAVAAR